MIGVTGSTGFVGSHVIAAARAAGLDCVPLTRRAGEGERPFDLTDPVRRMAEMLTGLETVVHAGGYVPPDLRDPDEAESCWRVNALGSLNLVRACRAAGVRRFVHVSAANILAGVQRPLREEDPFNPIHPQAPYYLGSKALAETWVRAQAGPGIDIIVVRPSAIYGPRMRRGVIARIADALTTGAPLTLELGGAYRADFVFVGDVANVIVAAAAAAPTGVVNVGSGTTTSVLELGKTMAELIGADPSLLHVAASSEPPVAIGFGCLDIGRAREWFGFEPTPLREGLRQYLAWLASTNGVGFQR